MDSDKVVLEKDPASKGVFIPGKRGRIFTTIYTPGGRGPHPVIIICHGLPGTEKLLDFAIVLREQEFCTISFHYSGCWGSDGTYSFANCQEDVDSVADYVRRNEEGQFDLSKVFILGHSLGGLMASYALAGNELILAGVIIMPANVEEDFKRAAQSVGEEKQVADIYNNEFAPWLKGFSWELSKREAEENLFRFSLVSYAKGISDKNVLLIAGTEDEVLEREKHIDKLAEAVAGYKKGKVRMLEFITDHGMNKNRSEIILAAVNFFNEQKQIRRLGT